ncbi:hypothetical protein OAD85_03065 [Actinomycetota bacterium]|nr:hypothetical protein [Actinomycetota bacterium]
MSEDNPRRISPGLLHDPLSLLGMQHEVSNEKSDATESTLDSYKRSILDLYKRFPTGFLFTKESIELYGGTDKLIGKIGLNRRNPKTPLQVFGRLSQLVGSKKHEDVMLAQTFFDNISLYLESFSPVSEIELLSTRLRYGSNVWQDFVVTQFGFRANRLTQFFPKVELHARIVELRAKGDSYGEIGSESGVTRERIRQILQRIYQMLDDHGASDVLEDVAQRVEVSKPYWKTEKFERALRIRQRILRTPGISLETLASGEGMDPSEVKPQVPKDLRKFVAGFNETRHSDLVPEGDILDSIRLAGTFHFPLAAPQFDELVDLGEVPGPKSQAIAKRFGSWKNACKSAGVECNTSGRSEYSEKWSDTEMVGFVVDYLLHPGTSGSFQNYEEWRVGQQYAAPSGSFMRHKLGTWTTVSSYALTRIGEMGPLDANVYGYQGEEITS